MNSSSYLNDRAQSLLKKIKMDKNAESNIEYIENYLLYTQKNRTKDFDILSEKKKFIDLYLSFPEKERENKLLRDTDFPYLMGLWPRESSVLKTQNAINKQIVLPYLEYNFLKCIINGSVSENGIYSEACGYIIDDLTCYFDGTNSSRMELLLNSDYEVPQEQIVRSKKIIEKLIKNYISKYNNQPIFTPDIGKNRAKVLVVDQSYRDFSITKGCADDNTFKLMLETAIKENPDSDILIKTHPDAIGKNSIKPLFYYKDVKEEGNVYKITEPINPISMINYADKVYVCSSQFGFEALMCGKEVHTFGMPFYANWGLTIDAQKCPRRTRNRSLEEIFYIAYILMSVYVNPETQQTCEIEEVVDYLIKYRDKYFKEIKNA